MIGVAALIMLRALARDRAALAMAFALPPLLFLVFAAIFSGAGGRELKVKVGVLDLAHTTASRRFVSALERERAFRFIETHAGGEAQMDELVSRGMADVGLVIQGDPASPAGGRPALLVVEEAARPLAATLLAGQAQRTLSERFPGAVLGRALAAAHARGEIDDTSYALISGALAAQPASAAGADPPALVQRRVVGAARGRNGNVLYYAGAVSAVFALLTCMQGALSLVDERTGGVAERLMLGRGGMAAIAAGKFLFLSAQALAQSALIFACAALVFGATFSPARLPLWLGAGVLASAAAAGLALACAALCRTRRQAETATTFGVLLLSAAGGSMIPRYLMPPWLQDLSWLTPNAWIIQAFDLAVRPAASLGETAAAWGVLLAIAAAGLGLCLALLSRAARPAA